ncbi:hypothetical protein Tco_0236408 [Tanacetum coccineum]
MSSSTVTYTSIYFDSEPWRFQWVSYDELKTPEEAPQSSGQAPPSPDYVPGHEHPPSPDYVPRPKEPGQAPLSPDYDQPLPDDASPTTLSPGYVVDSDPVEDPEEDPADEGDDNDDDEDDKEDEEEEHLAPADSTTLQTIDPVSSAEDIEAFETDESTPTPPSPKSHGARISVQPQTPMSATVEALIAEYASAPTPPSPAPSPLTPLSSSLPHILSPPLPLPSPHTHTSPHPTYASLTYAESPLGYRAAEIRLRAASPSTHHPSEILSLPLLLPSTTHRDDLPEADMPLRKRAHFTTPTGRFEVG